VTTYIALFRGINVGGKNVLPMKDLVALLERLSFQDVKTYIQSGNAVFRSKVKSPAVLSKSIRSSVKSSFGFEAHVIVLNRDELERAIRSNPYPEAEAEPKTLHVFFLDSRPKNPDLHRLESVRLDSEHFKLVDKVFYLHAPDGIGKCKLAARVERALGVPATARNWRTVQKVAALAKGKE